MNVGDQQQQADYERCDSCGRIAKDVTFDYLGPDPNDIDLEAWGYLCGADMGCNAFAVEAE